MRHFHGYTDLGDVTEIFNAEVAATDTHVTLTQTRFIETLTALHLSNTFEKAHTPADVTLTEVIARAQAEGAVPLGAEEHAAYRAIVGAILYLATVCRPDVAVAVGLCPVFSRNPPPRHSRRQSVRCAIFTPTVPLVYAGRLVLALHSLGSRTRTGQWRAPPQGMCSSCARQPLHTYARSKSP